MVGDAPLAWCERGDPCLCVAAHVKTLAQRLTRGRAIAAAAQRGAVVDERVRVLEARRARSRCSTASCRSDRPRSPRSMSPLVRSAWPMAPECPSDEPR
jgi:hypothetical protein